MILVHCALVLLSLNCVRTSPESYKEMNHKFSLWPSSVHNAIQKREAAQANGISEGGGIQVNASPAVTTMATPKPDDQINKTDDKPAIVSVTNKPDATPISNKTTTEAIPATVVNKTANVNTTSDVKPTGNALDLSNPGVAKRGAIVFGGFLLLAVAYYIFYRRNHAKTESNNPNTNDTNQFRYGVLQSDDRRANLELSQVPLTMESDDEEDEDLEIFDLGHKKKSLSYINLQTNDEDLVFDTPRRELDKNNLLLDIEDSNGSETLINWSSNGSKSIL